MLNKLTGKGIVLIAVACLLLVSLASCHRHHRHKQKTVAVKPRNAKPHINTGKVNRVASPATVKQKYATILGVKPQAITNYPLYQFIDKWYGTAYRLGGTTKGGIDCSGFVQRLYSEVYRTNVMRTASEQFGKCRFLKSSKNAVEGDLVFFRINSRQISHVGIYLANDHFVHASTSGGVMISSLREDYWRRYFAGCGRLPH